MEDVYPIRLCFNKKELVYEKLREATKDLRAERLERLIAELKGELSDESSI